MLITPTFLQNNRKTPLNFPTFVWRYTLQRSTLKKITQDTMAKKNFQSGLDTLLTNALEDKPSKGKGRTTTHATSKRKDKKKKNIKSFASNLDAFFQDTLEETVREQIQKTPPTPASPTKKTKNTKKTAKTKKSTRKKPVFGIDSLIRATVESSKVEITPDEKKRVTFIFDKTKIEKLKNIARLEKAYVKDIINQLVSEYIDTYERGN